MDAPAGSHAVLVPVKSFRGAKGRLGRALAPAARSALARSMAEHVVVASAPAAVAVVHDDAEVGTWAENLGALAIDGPPGDLDAAVDLGRRRLAELGFSRVTIAHADLPLAHNLDRFAAAKGIVLVADRQRSGTNVISLPAGCDFSFQYGLGSFARHLAEARRRSDDVTVDDDPLLAFDVDVPADLAELPTWLSGVVDVVSK